MTLPSPLTTPPRAESSDGRARYRKLSTSLAPGGADVRIDVVDDGVLPPDQQAGAVGSPGTAAIRADRPARPACRGWRSFSQRARIRAETSLPVFSPPSLNVGSLGPATRLPPRRTAVRWRARRRCAAAAASASRSRSGTGTPARTALCPSASHDRRHPEAGRRARDIPCRGPYRAGPVGGADLIVGGQLQCRLLGGDLRLNIALIASGVIGISGDFIHRNSAASCLFVPMISGTGCDQPSRGQLDRVVGHHVAVDDRREGQRARALQRAPR